MRQLASTELSVFELCLGGNVFGWTADEKASFAILDAYFDAGGNFIDTADVYGAWVGTPGISEEIIGRWMKARNNRDQIVIATKVGAMQGLSGLHASTIHEAADGSLRRLGVDHIDLYYAHKDDESTSIEEALSGFDSLVKAGKVRYIGASNFDADRLQHSLKVSEREGFAKYVALQPEYNLVARDYENELQAAVGATDISTMPYYGLAAGFLTGKYTRNNRGQVDSPRAGGAEKYLNESGFRTVDALQTIASSHSVSMSAVALAWLAAQPTITSPIASARNVDQLNDLLVFPSLTLSTNELETLTNAR